MATNATRHGIYSLSPDVPGEDAGTWSRHRAGILAALAPAAALERRLAERVALLLWRLDRASRFEAGSIAAATEAASAVGRAAQVDDGARALMAIMGVEPAAWPAELAGDLARTRGVIARQEAALAALCGLADSPDDAPPSSGVVFAILEGACDPVPLDAEFPFIDSRPFLAVLGASDDDGFHDLRWTAGLLRQAVALIAPKAGVGVPKLLKLAARAVESHRDTLQKSLDKRTAQAEECRQAEQRVADWTRAEALLPPDAALAKVERYEAHLSRQLFQTLHDLERLQAWRSGRRVPLPLPVDVNAPPAGG